MARHAHLPWAQQVMAAMLSAVDDGVGAITAEVEHLGLAGNTCTFYSSDNGPSRESRNWLDGTLDPYYGGSAGALKGGKFSLYEGGIRVPAILHWPGTIPGGRVLSAPCAAMDLFPTLLGAAGGDVLGYELDGSDLLPYLCEGKASPERAVCWEMNAQTAIRRGPWKLVLNGQLVEGAPPEDAVHLANLEVDPGERANLLSTNPQVAGELQHEALAWRAGIERRWLEEFGPRGSGTTGRV
jgi:arylsulfatase A-like enzyme